MGFVYRVIQGLYRVYVVYRVCRVYSRGFTGIPGLKGSCAMKIMFQTETGVGSRIRYYIQIEEHSSLGFIFLLCWSNSSCLRVLYADLVL